MRAFFRRVLEAMRKPHRTLPTALTRDEAVEIARLAIEPTGLWRPEIAATPRLSQDDSTRTVWDIVTNVPNRGAHARIIVDDATGEILKRWLVSR